MKRILAIFLFALAGGIVALTAQTQEGRGTWYETDSKGLTASHATLPLGTRVRVTNLQNEKQVIVTINNRIVETPNRLIDISKAASDNLEMNPRGTTPVRIEVLSRRAVATTDTPVTPVTPTDTTTPPPVEPAVNNVREETPVTPPEDEELTVTTTATARRPAATPEQTQAPAPAPAPAATNPGIVNQTIITINGTSMAPGQTGTPVAVSTDPVYSSTP
ncbi:MAG: septal ring lytic transglycosylase RlpA family protein, partial [Treponema sp.]|nr:septal ring lytic transglycosylase RlpA family protein [Treponema sp.]